MSFRNFTSIYFNLFFKICDYNTQIATKFHINSHFTLMFQLILEISSAQKFAFICKPRVITKYIALKVPNFSLKSTYISSFMLRKSFRSSVRKVFSKILQNSQENTCVRASFFNQKEAPTQLFSCEFAKF